MPEKDYVFGEKFIESLDEHLIIDQEDGELFIVVSPAGDRLHIYEKVVSKDEKKRKKGNKDAAIPIGKIIDLANFAHIEDANASFKDLISKRNKKKLDARILRDGASAKEVISVIQSGQERLPIN